MLPKTHRLAKDRDVQAVLRRGRSYFDQRITLRRRMQPGAKRFTVVVSTKVSKSAVKRNRIKRIIREFVRLHIESIADGDYMIIVRPIVARFTSAELLGTIEEVFRRNRLLR